MPDPAHKIEHGQGGPKTQPSDFGPLAAAGLRAGGLGTAQEETAEEEEHLDPFEVLAKLLNNAYLLGGDSRDRVKTLTMKSFGLDRFELLLQEIHRHPPSRSLQDPAVQTKFAAKGMLPIIETRSHDIVIAINALDGTVENVVGTDVIDFRDNKKNFIKRVFRDEGVRDRIRYLLLPQDVYVKVTTLAYDLEARTKELNLLDPQVVADRFFLAVVDRAIRMRASDIHIEPRADGTVGIRYRVDGDLMDAMDPLTGETGNKLVNVIRIKAKIEFAAHRTALDGSIFFTDENIRDYNMLRGHNLRVVTLPAKDAEEVVIRILRDVKVSLLTLDKLGFTDRQLKDLERIIQSPDGVILVSGPTGSGKTTTLYSALQALNTKDRKIITIEEPVEGRVNGITQCEVNRTGNVTYAFAEALRSFLRADPDIILVGEVRDEETAQVMVQASMTGHLVFSTVHAADSISVLNRLIKNFNVDEVLIQNSLLAVLSQRLVRKLCPHCAEPYDARSELNKAFGADLFPEVCGESNEEHPVSIEDDPNAVIMYRPIANPNKGCGHCKGLGFAGQTVVLELWEIGGKEQELIARRVTDNSQYLNVALEKGFQPMAMVGLGLALNGVTSLTELVQRIFRSASLVERPDLYKNYILANRKPLTLKQGQRKEEGIPNTTTATP